MGIPDKQISHSGAFFYRAADFGSKAETAIV
jgi:hypothetical protein